MSKDLPPSRTADQFVVRFPDGMRDQIAALAKANNRSMNAEIVARLQGSLETGAVLGPRVGNVVTSAEGQADELAERIAKKLVATLRPDGLDLVTGGQPTIKQGPPTDPEAKD
ncbi:MULTISPECIES: Arc family DNA-binding protein [Delftia]|uniref:Arc family DNA-binding protein n=1 Tax=Delftia TaxID=80865 RepID=UPI000F845E95|nr:MULTISPECIES: Arc family DNA-binding protein [Delftia]KAA9181991.1 Arc family DNA-binding protein [Delftia sp. BR1]WEL96960.1 Arc family DNA-binding protein [Delftia tsuruhatensis]WQM84904.1 Arc family DNA-binding protein [Delftia tsuruhatensis]